MHNECNANECNVFFVFFQNTTGFTNTFCILQTVQFSNTVFNFEIAKIKLCAFMDFGDVSHSKISKRDPQIAYMSYICLPREMKTHKYCLYFPNQNNWLSTMFLHIIMTLN